jgi:uncharacterized protein YcfJ
MALNNLQRAFGIFSEPRNVEGAMQELKDFGFPMAQVSVIRKDSEGQHLTEKHVGNNAQEGTNVGAIAGGAIGGTLGLAIGLGTAALIPGVGPLVLLGEAALALATTVTSGVIGATTGGLLGALIGYGVPEKQATVYSDRIGQGAYFVMIDGTAPEVRQAEAILRRWNIQELRIYDSLTASPQ